ncbi:Crp/Fnr family transcriptional regulator [Melioribacter sp. Ez-97]|uniref:Crp/Fnr family transcriptional regulator n=1 Tax=Melioribacter sp. Ez-97 TaxID=3423434 RepID=UPI003ED9EB29
MEAGSFLKYVPIFSNLPEDTLKSIENSGARKIYSKNEVILKEDESGTALFIILSGKVKVSRTSEDGKEVILSILSENDFFGEMAILDGQTRSATVTAIEDSEIFIIQRNDFIELLKEHHDVALALLEELTRRLRSADVKIKALSLKDAEGKVATVLLELAESIGKIKQGKVELEKLPVQQDIANMAGTSRETISRTLHSFAKKGLIEIDGPNIRIVDYEKFKELYG